MKKLLSIVLVLLLGINAGISAQYYSDYCRVRCQYDPSGECLRWCR